MDNDNEQNAAVAEEAAPAKKTEKKPAAKKAVAPAKKPAVKVVAKKAADKSEAKAAYGVDYVAEKLGTEPHLARIKLRNASIKKSGRSYGWDKKSDADEVVKKLKAA